MVRHVAGEESPGDEYERGMRIRASPRIEGCTSLLLTRYVDKNCIDVRRNLRRGISVQRLHPAFREPLSDEIAVKAVVLHDQHAFH